VLWCVFLIVKGSWVDSVSDNLVSKSNRLNLVQAKVC